MNPEQSAARESYRSRIFRSYQDSLARELEVRRDTDPSATYHPTYRQHYLPRLPADPASCILDVGCGVGYLIEFLRQQGYRNVRGVDISPQMVRLSRERELSVEEADAAPYLRARPGAFDCILAMDVLEHLYKDELVSLLDAVHVALKPGGCFLAHTLNADGLSWGRMRYIDLTHEIAFTRYSLAQLFQVTGFARSEFYPMEPVAAGLRGHLRRAAWNIFRFLAGAYYHMEMGSGILHNDHILTPSVLAKAVKSG